LETLLLDSGPLASDFFKTFLEMEGNIFSRKVINISCKLTNRKKRFLLLRATAFCAIWAIENRCRLELAIPMRQRDN